MTTLNSTSVLASIIAQNPYHIISIQGQMPMSHAQNTYDFEIAEDDPHYDDMVNYSGDMLWVYTYADKESLELDLMDILNQMDLLRGCDDQYFDYNVDEVDMVLYGATIIQEQEKYKPLIMQKYPTKQRNKMKKKSKNQVYIPHQDKWNEHFPTPGKPNPNYYTDSGATFNKHLRTQNKLKSKQK